VNEPAFVRRRDLAGLNSLLNYGYAVLLSTVLQKLFGVGLDPTFGLSHAVRERSTPLAYDIMEPFRPCVDWRVQQWVKRQSADVELQVTKEYRGWITAFALERVQYRGQTLELQAVIEHVARGFRQSVLQQRLQPYQPWTSKSSKWAG
jgi:CRISPR-associated protein Cas1